MLNDLLKSISTIYIAYGATDFRKQIHTGKDDPDADRHSDINHFIVGADQSGNAETILCNKRKKEYPGGIF